MQSTTGKIVVTGFGPFAHHEVNDSWECVKKLKELNIEDELGVSLVIQEIPVMYEVSEKEVPSIWEKHNPELVIHVGVHNSTNIAIEKVGRKTGYKRPDISGACPSTECCPLGTEDTITTCIDLDDIVKEVDSRGMDLSISENAGRYLCEYTYYLSLCQDSGRALFVHIPPAGSAPTIEDKALALKNIVVAAYRQLKTAVVTDINYQVEDIPEH